MPVDRHGPKMISGLLRVLVDGGELSPPTQLGPLGQVYVVTDRGAAALTEDLW